MAYLFPAQGFQLTQATYDGTNPPLITYPVQPIIANGEYTDAMTVADSRATILSVVYNAAPGATTEIHISPDNTFANYFVIDTLPISANKFAEWTTLERLVGFLRIKNTSTAQINSVFIQKEVASFG